MDNKKRAHCEHAFFDFGAQIFAPVGMIAVFFGKISGKGGVFYEYLN